MINQFTVQIHAQILMNTKFMYFKIFHKVGHDANILYFKNACFRETHIFVKTLLAAVLLASNLHRCTFTIVQRPYHQSLIERITHSILITGSITYVLNTDAPCFPFLLGKDWWFGFSTFSSFYISPHIFPSFSIPPYSYYFLQGEDIYGIEEEEEVEESVKREV